MINSGTYESGMIDALSMWGRVCGNEGGCADCPIFAVRGTGLTCQEFAKKSPEKMVSLLQELDKRPVTYYSEYNLRFPNSQLTLEDLAGVTCRKVAFEGYFGCDDFDNIEKCKQCWSEPYTGDVTVEKELPEQVSNTAYCTNCGAQINEGAKFCTECGTRL
ncbi:MAG: zinc ribbon domain-containing protein [Acetatifactor sp.]|nr:zinc ribbon domain-containing protein [Acetatifactor sp.]